MEEEQNNIQQPKKDGFIKKSANRVEKVKNKAQKVKKTVKAVKFIIKNWKPILIAIAVLIGIFIFGLCIYAINDKIFEEGSTSKRDAVTVSVSGNAEETDENRTDEITVTITPNASGATQEIQVAEKSTAKIVISKTDDDNYSIEPSYTDEELQKVKEKLEGTTMKVEEFSDFELAVIGALEENGIDVDDYTTKELKCLPAFLKAESATQFLDLRKNSEKFDSSGNYQPELLEDLEENEVPGIILIQRTNTKDNKTTPLEFMKLEDFDELVEAKDMKVLNYFTVTEEGKLRIAKWNHQEVEVNEEDYPDEISDDQRIQDKDETSIWTEDIDYVRYISKYVLPYDFLLQLLVISEDPEFCLDVTDIVLGSKIVINLQEEQSITTTVDTRTFDVHNKVEKKIDYNIGNESQKGYLLNLEGKEDDKGIACTTYEKKTSTVTATTVYTGHTYKFGIVEADIWYARYEEIYKKPTEKNESLPIQEIEDIKENYTLIEANKKDTTNTNEILADEHVKEFKKVKEKYYKDRVTVPKVKLIQSDPKEIYDPTQRKFIQLPGSYTINITPANKIKSPTWTSETFSTYEDLPNPLTVTTKTTNDFPFEAKFTFTLNGNEYVNISQSDSIVCNISRLLVLPYNKIDVVGSVTSSVKRYESDPEPTIKTRYYAKDENGDFEKFLKAIDNYEKAEELLGDVELWLFEMMEECDTTQSFVEIVKYLFYLYDGVDRGVTELDLEALIKPMDMNLIGGANIPTTTPILSRENFIKALQEYNGGNNYVEDFRNKAGQIYDWGIRYGVNPELVVTFALKEQSFNRPSSTNYNYWGLDTPNGSGVAFVASMEEGVKRFAEITNSYGPSGSKAGLILDRKKVRQAENCNTNGYGDPGTLKGMLSVYSDLCGNNTKHREGDSGDGGNHYLKIIYGNEFNAKCGNVHRIGIDDYTNQEKADYTAYLYEKQIKFWTDIFGKYGSLGIGGGTDIIEYAMQYLGKGESEMYSIMNYHSAWCAYFATWCYQQCGYVPETIDHTYTSCTALMNYARGKNSWYSASSGYIPMSGDFIFYGTSENNLTHVGLVIECDGSRVHTIEGNWSNKVAKRNLPLSGPLPDTSKVIVGYASLAALKSN